MVRMILLNVKVVYSDLIYSGNHAMNMPRLLAHEFGHLLGSDHDGDEPA